MQKIIVKPSASGAMRVEGGEIMGGILHRSRAMEREGKGEQACALRFDGVKRVLEALDDDVKLDWDDAPTRSVLELIYASAADHLAIGDVEMAVALWERLTELDEEDHTEAVVMLALCYAELEDFDCFDDAMFDISPKSPEYLLLRLWGSYRHDGHIDDEALRGLRARHKAWAEEFTAEDHPADEAYMEDCRREHPSAATEAREFWFATSPLWAQHPEFISKVKEALQKKQDHAE